MNTLEKGGLKVMGVKELNHMFKDLPKKISNARKWNTLWREIGKPLIINAKAEAPKKTKQLSKSIGYFTTKRSRKFLGGMIGPRVKKSFAKLNKSGFYGAWIEYGATTNFGRRGSGENQPFMRKAFDNTKDIMNRNARISTLKTVEKLMKSYLKRTQKYGTLGI